MLKLKKNVQDFVHSNHPSISESTVYSVDNLLSMMGKGEDLTLSLSEPKNSRTLLHRYAYKEMILGVTWSQIVSGRLASINDLPAAVLYTINNAW